MLRPRPWLLVFGVLAATQLVAAQAPVAPPPLSAGQLPALAPGDTIAVDPQITVATLPNGLRYYVRPNGQPRGRAELRLVVKTGSVLEDDDQRGLAHFVEHMAFNGTMHFPGNAIGTFMQRIGMRFGAHVNAHTSFDETVYELHVPTEPAVLDQALLMMEDWARGVTFPPGEVDRERGVILEDRCSWARAWCSRAPPRCASRATSEPRAPRATPSVAAATRHHTLRGHGTSTRTWFDGAPVPQADCATTCSRYVPAVTGPDSACSSPTSAASWWPAPPLPGVETRRV